MSSQIGYYYHGGFWSGPFTAYLDERGNAATPFLPNRVSVRWVTSISWRVFFDAPPSPKNRRKKNAVRFLPLVFSPLQPQNRVPPKKGTPIFEHVVISALLGMAAPIWGPSLEPLCVRLHNQRTAVSRFIITSWTTAKHCRDVVLSGRSFPSCALLLTS